MARIQQRAEANSASTPAPAARRTPPAIQRLREALANLPPGTVDSDVVSLVSLVWLLGCAWSSLHGSCAREMTREKLAGRVLNVHWSPPVLSFDVDRGADGATRELQPWQVDAQDGTAWIPAELRRELPPKTGAADLALSLVRDIVAGRGSLAVMRRPDGAVSIRPGDVPGLDVGFVETLPGRHGRFRAVLESAMLEAGFTKTGRYRFRREQ